MSHPDPNHDPENVKPFDDDLSPLERLERDFEEQGVPEKTTDIRFEELERYDPREWYLDDNEPDYVDLLARLKKKT